MADWIALSGRICSALQLAEHWQDVAEDRAAGRVYLPAEDLDRFAVAETDLDGHATGANLRALMAFEVARARELLDSGAPLVNRLRGRGRIAVAGYVAGGLAALDAIDAAGHDVLAGLAACVCRSPRSPYSRPHPPRRLTMPSLELAYEHCRGIARDAGSSFYAGMRLLPPDRRSALFAIYALAREIDDIADGDLAADDSNT